MMDVDHRISKPVRFQQQSVVDQWSEFAAAFADVYASHKDTTSSSSTCSDATSSLSSAPSSCALWQIQKKADEILLLSERAAAACRLQHRQRRAAAKLEKNNNNKRSIQHQQPITERRSKHQTDEKKKNRRSPDVNESGPTGTGMQSVLSALVGRAQMWVGSFNKRVNHFGITTTSAMSASVSSADSSFSSSSSPLNALIHFVLVDQCGEGEGDGSLNAAVDDASLSQDECNSILLALAAATSSRESLASACAGLEVSIATLCDSLASLATTSSLQHQQQQQQQQAQNGTATNSAAAFSAAVQNALLEHLNNSQQQLQLLNGEQEAEEIRFLHDSPAHRLTRLWLEVGCILALSPTATTSAATAASSTTDFSSTKLQSQKEQMLQERSQYLEETISRPFHVIIDRCVGRLAHHFTSTTNSSNGGVSEQQDDTDRAGEAGPGNAGNDDADVDINRLPSWRVEYFFTFAIELLRESITPCLLLLGLIDPSLFFHDAAAADEIGQKNGEHRRKDHQQEEGQRLTLIREVLLRSLLNRYARSVAALFGAIYFSPLMRFHQQLLNLNDNCDPDDGASSQEDKDDAEDGTFRKEKMTRSKAAAAVAGKNAPESRTYAAVAEKLTKRVGGQVTQVTSVFKSVAQRALGDIDGKSGSSAASSTSLSLAQRLLLHTVNTLETFLSDWVAETSAFGAQPPQNVSLNPQQQSPISTSVASPSSRSSSSSSSFELPPFLSPCTAILSLPGVFDVWLEAERTALFACLGFFTDSALSSTAAELLKSHQQQQQQEQTEENGSSMVLTVKEETVGNADDEWRRVTLQQRDVATIFNNSVSSTKASSSHQKIKTIPRACRLACHLFLGLITRVENVLVVSFDKDGNHHDPALDAAAAAVAVGAAGSSGSHSTSTSYVPSSFSKLLKIGTTLSSITDIGGGVEGDGPNGGVVSTASPSILRAIFVEKVLVRTIRVIHSMLLHEFEDLVDALVEHQNQRSSSSTTIASPPTAATPDTPNAPTMVFAEGSGGHTHDPLQMAFLEIITVAGPLSHLLHDIEVALEPTLHQLHLNSVGNSAGQFFAIIDERWDRVWVELQDALMKCHRTQEGIVERWVTEWCKADAVQWGRVNFEQLRAAVSPAFFKRLRKEAEGIESSSQGSSEEEYVDVASAATESVTTGKVKEDKDESENNGAKTTTEINAAIASSPAELDAMRENDAALQEPHSAQVGDRQVDKKAEAAAASTHDDGQQQQQLVSVSAETEQQDYVVDHRARIVRFYEKYNPEKLNNVDKTLTKYKGHEVKLFQLLVEKYGPEPSTSSDEPTTTPWPFASASSLTNTGIPESNDHHQLANIVSEPQTPTAAELVMTHIVEGEKDRLGLISNNSTVVNNTHHHTTPTPFVKGKTRRLSAPLADPTALLVSASGGFVSPAKHDHGFSVSNAIAQKEKAAAAADGTLESNPSAADADSFNGPPLRRTNTERYVEETISKLKGPHVNQLLPNFGEIGTSSPIDGGNHHSSDATGTPVTTDESSALSETESLTTEEGDHDQDPIVNDDDIEENDVAETESTTTSGMTHDSESEDDSSTANSSMYEERSATQQAAALARLQRFYQKYNPEKLSDCEAILQKFPSTTDLFRRLVMRYGPEPEDESGGLVGGVAGSEGLDGAEGGAGTGGGGSNYMISSSAPRIGSSASTAAALAAAATAAAAGKDAATTATAPIPLSVLAGPANHQSGHRGSDTPIDGEEPIVSVSAPVTTQRKTPTEISLAKMMNPNPTATATMSSTIAAAAAPLVPKSLVQICRAHRVSFPELVLLNPHIRGSDPYEPLPSGTQLIVPEPRSKVMMFSWAESCSAQNVILAAAAAGQTTATVTTKASEQSDVVKFVKVTIDDDGKPSSKSKAPLFQVRDLSWRYDGGKDRYFS